MRVARQLVEDTGMKTFAVEAARWASGLKSEEPDP
jgi:hypothetical protein